MISRSPPGTVDPMTTTKENDAPAVRGMSYDDGLVPPRGRRSLAAWCADRRWRTLLAALTVVAGAILLLGTGLHTTSASDQDVGDSRQATKTVEGADFGDRPTENVVVSARSGKLSKATVRAVGGELRAAYTGLTGVAEVGKPQLS